MKYPEFLQNGDIIGITALSAGIGEKIERFEFSISNLHKNGFKTIETSNVRSKEYVSSSAEQRVEELNELLLNKDVKMILSATGGDFLIEILPKLDLEKIKNNEKWFMGYSDPSTLLHLITTKLDIATIYGVNAGSYAQDELHECLKNNIEIIKGNLVEQNSFELYEKEGIEGLYQYNLTEKVFWENINGEFNEKGRIIGGCIDALRFLLGTPHDYTKEFVNKYKDDGIIWYFDVFCMSSEELYGTLFQMKEAGWFENTKGVIFGRVIFPREFTLTYQESIKRFFKEIPVVFNADIGHMPPKMTIINGAYAHVQAKEGKGKIKFELK